MNAVLPLSGASSGDPGSSALLARLLTDAFEGLDGNIDHVRASLSRAVALVDGASMSAEAIGRGGLAPWQVRKISAVVDANLEHGVRITELAAGARLSKSHFSRAFKAHFGRSPQQYILERRVARAQHLMLVSSWRLCDVAQACGFADQAHLSRTFRRMVGVAPNAWRRARFGP
jgi:transcriptional regulator GlxA family with amidase domain